MEVGPFPEGSTSSKEEKSILKESRGFDVGLTETEGKDEL